MISWVTGNPTQGKNGDRILRRLTANFTFRHLTMTKRILRPSRNDSSLPTNRLPVFKLLLRGEKPERNNSAAS